MGDFQVTLVEGIFYNLGGDLACQTDAGPEVLIVDQLRPFLGEEVQLAIHHLPPMPPDPTKWGGGCCHWQPSRCPAGHHKNPGFLLNFTGQGGLERKGRNWFLTDKFRAKQTPIPLDFLEGHQARLVITTVFDLEKMKDSLAGADLSVLGEKAADLKDLLSRFQQLIKKD